MADHFYSNQLTSNADGTLTDSSHLGNSSKYGTTQKFHSITCSIPTGLNFAPGDKIVLAIVPTDFKIHRMELFNMAFAAGSTVKLGLFQVGHDGSVGNKVSANSDDMFEAASIDLAVAAVLYDVFTAAHSGLDHYQRNLQLWENLNRVENTNGNPDVYTENPGGNWAIAFEFIGNPAGAAANSMIYLDLMYTSAAN